jgi:hypothetical protein
MMKGVVEVSELGAGVFMGDGMRLFDLNHFCLASWLKYTWSHLTLICGWLWPVSIVIAAAVLLSRFAGHSVLWPNCSALINTCCTKPEGSLWSSIPSPRSLFADSTSTTIE